MPPARRNTQPESLAGTASERVRAIIEAAEASAEEIRAEAQAEAERIRTRAEERARELRSEVQSDVQGLIASIREGVDRLRTDLESLEQRLGESEGEQRSGESEGEERLGESEAARAHPVAAATEEDPDIALAEDAAVAGAEAGDADLDAARLVALNMALDGASRDDVARHLRENYNVKDPAPLLDEVFTSLG